LLHVWVRHSGIAGHHFLAGVSQFCDL
jgi:hypothetical protein